MHHVPTDSLQETALLQTGHQPTAPEQERSFPGEKSGLMLVIDTNTERSINRANEIKLTRSEEIGIVMNLANLPRIQESTLALWLLSPVLDLGTTNYPP